MKNSSTTKKASYAIEDETLELIRLGKMPEALRLAEGLEKHTEYTPMFGKAADCLRKMHAELESIKQAITDPENQPSQFGTVTLEYMQREVAAQPAPVQEPADEPVAWAKRAMDLATDFAIESLRVGSYERKDTYEHTGLASYQTVELRAKREAARERLRQHLYTRPQPAVLHPSAAQSAVLLHPSAAPAQDFDAWWESAIKTLDVSDDHDAYIGARAAWNATNGIKGEA
jgi:hypothetical protein